MRGLQSVDRKNVPSGAVDDFRGKRHPGFNVKVWVEVS